MNQTDWQGETERALRALTCRECANGTPLYDAKHHHGRGAASVLPCTYNPELLPLFNAGVAGAYAAAAKLCADVTAPFTLDKENNRVYLPVEIVTAELAKLILALTPADARQAQTPKELHARCWWCDRDISQLGASESCTHPESTPEVVEAAILLICMDACDHFCCGKPANICRATKLAAAIASAEARAQLQIDYLLHRIEVLSCSGCMDGKSKHPHWGQVWHGRPEPFTGEWIPTTRCMSQRESAAEAALARTPDSTKEPE